MFIGVMAPQIHPSEYPIKFHKLHVVTMFRAQPEEKEISATLEYKKYIKKEEKIIEVESYSTSHKNREEDKEWIIISNLPIEDVEFEYGDKIIFDLDYNGEKERISVTALETIDDL